MACVRGAEPGPPLAACCWGLTHGAGSLISRKGRQSELCCLSGSKPQPPRPLSGSWGSARRLT